ncbi:MAG: RNA-guided endonuclease InsQ/TnpB family protein [Hyphomicrobium sp.]|uniref:RNA-guided endonuclease InsQ/TnpB family protein n=1 Tax=Hyphomicrobium sp. TaxID=82 RepID=UPI003D121A49
MNAPVRIDEVVPKARANDTAAPATMVLTVAVRLQPTRQQHRDLERVSEQQRILYNAALEERIECYRKTGKTLNDIAQSKSLTIIRADDPAFAGVQRRIQRATLIRLQRAFQAFFRRAKAGAGAQSGFPRFKGREHWDGFGFDAPLQIAFDGRRLRFAGVHGGIRVSRHDASRLPQPLVAGAGGNWKGIHFKRTRTGWAATFQVEVPIAAGRGGMGRGAVGVDWGTSVLAALSTGQIEDNPRPREAASRELRRRERKLARAQRGSKRRMKARRRKQAVEAAIANRRRNRLDKLSKMLVTNYRTVAIEDIAVKNMMGAERPGEDLPEHVKRRRNREALDAAPYKLRQMLAYKATLNRADLILVDPKNTTHECFWCGLPHFKELADAEHVCTTPGLYFGKRAPRKVNAARVILKRALASAPAPERASKALSGIAKGPDDTAGRGRAGGGKPPNGGSALRRPGNTSGRRKAAADGSRSG